jgi:hypothetical protein
VTVGELGILTRILRDYVPTQILQITTLPFPATHRCFSIKTASARVVLSLQMGPTSHCTHVRRSNAGGDGIVALPRFFQDRICCICKYSDVIEIYVQVLWLPVYFTLASGKAKGEDRLHLGVPGDWLVR